MKILILAGTRPEIVKLAPIFHILQSSKKLDVSFITSGQHSTLLETALQDLAINPEVRLDVMSKNQSLAELSTKLISELTPTIRDISPSIIIVQGDTTTALMGALCGFYEKIPVAHVEAGLRTTDKFEPFPEEMNRRLISVIADLHFAPTDEGRLALLREGVEPNKIFVTGNTGIDSLYLIRSNVEMGKNYLSPQLSRDLESKEYILITCHRRESFGAKLLGIISAIKESAYKNPSIIFLIVLHPNPNTSEPFREILSGIKNVILVDSQNYGAFVQLMVGAKFIVSDSGGVQEEGPTLGKRVLVLRDRTERGEAIQSGHLEIIGTNPENIYRAIDSEINSIIRIPDSTAYGDGQASSRILQIIENEINGK
jgi:UDP-N-acetylglucosamine 2-epimerase (non-hydrolysing)